MITAMSWQPNAQFYIVGNSHRLASSPSRLREHCERGDRKNLRAVRRKKEYCIAVFSRSTMITLILNQNNCVHSHKTLTRANSVIGPCEKRGQLPRPSSRIHKQLIISGNYIYYITVSKLFLFP